MMHRRNFIRLLSQGILGSALLPELAFGNHTVDKRRLQFVFAQLKYRGGDWNPHPLSVTPLMEELMARTSVEAATVRHEVSLTDQDLFNYPFLYLTGKYEFDPFTQEEIETLRRFLTYGGFMLIDDALGQQGYGFDKAVRREMLRVFPGNEFKRLPAGHAALRSYYLLRRVGGVRIVSPALDGITIGNSTPVVYSCTADVFDMCGQMVIVASTAPEQADEYLREVAALLAAHATAIDPIDLDRARNQIAVRRLHEAEKPLRRLEAAALGLFVRGHIRPRSETLARLSAVTGEEVRAAFERMLAAGPSAAIVGRVGRGAGERARAILG